MKPEWRFIFLLFVFKFFGNAPTRVEKMVAGTEFFFFFRLIQALFDLFFSFLDFFTIFLNFFLECSIPVWVETVTGMIFFFLGPDRPYLAKNEARVTFFI